MAKTRDVARVAMELLTSGDDSSGVCIRCLDVQCGVEPDAEKYRCESCDARTVYGAEQVLLLCGGFGYHVGGGA